MTGLGLAHQTWLLGQVLVLPVPVGWHPLGQPLLSNVYEVPLHDGNGVVQGAGEVGQ